MVQSSPPPLNILIVGAGPAGLAAAIGFRQQGHRVRLYERSSFHNEVGAAITLPPNINRILRSLSMNPKEFGADDEDQLHMFHSNGELIAEIDMKMVKNYFSNPARMIHRVDLHKGLKTIALKTGAEIILGSPVVSIDPAAGSITLDDGQIVTGDLIIGADGSKARRFITGDDRAPSPFGVSLFRILIPTEQIRANPETQELVSLPGQLFVYDDGKSRKMVLYPCRNNSLINIAAMFDDTAVIVNEKDPKETMLEIFSDFTGRAKALMNMADEIKVWRLYDLPTISTFINGKAVLIGDAAHPLLPYAGQGGAQAIEDSITLSILLPQGTPSSSLPRRLELYQNLRREHVTWVQEFSRSLGPGRKAMMPYPDFMYRAFGHDAVAAAQQELAWEEGRYERWVWLKVLKGVEIAGILAGVLRAKIAGA